MSVDVTVHVRGLRLGAVPPLLRRGSPGRDADGVVDRPEGRLSAPAREALP